MRTGDEIQDIVENQPNDTADGFLTGGGTNNNVTHPPETPDQPDTPIISGSFTQPEEPQPETPTPDTIRPSNNSAATSDSKPQTQTTTQKPSTTTPTVRIELTPITVTEDDPATIIPTAPNDNVAPAVIMETPHTGVIEETQSTVANPLAILLLIMAGITILAAGIFSAWLSRVDKRSRTAN